MKPEDRILRLLSWMTDPRPCRVCGQQIWFIKTKAGKMMPVTRDGESHFSNCPNADRFRKKK